MSKIAKNSKIMPECGEVRHSAYWYAKKYGIYHSDRTTYTGRYLDLIPVYWAFGDPIERRLGPGSFDPFVFTFYAAMDLGALMAREMKRLADPVQRRERKEQIQTQLRRIQRPIYYAREKRRRQELAIERRKIRRRMTLAPMPTPADVRAAWEARKESKARMILLGGMLQDLECYVDRRLFFDDAGNIVRRAGGIRGWLRENLPDLAPHYKTLMRYKAMAIKLRQATGLHDPTPTSALLEAGRREVVAEITGDENSCRNKNESISDGREEGFAADERNENYCRKENGRVGKKDGERGLCGEGMARRRMVMESVLDGQRETFAAILKVLDDELSPERVHCGREWNTHVEGHGLEIQSRKN